jgi:hypothetical protein
VSEIQSGDRGGDKLGRVDRRRHGPGVANAAAGQNPHSAVLFSNSSFFLLNCAPSALSAIFRAHAETEEKHIKNVYLKKVQALTGVKPVVKCCMELN